MSEINDQPEGRESIITVDDKQEEQPVYENSTEPTPRTSR